LLPKLFAGRGSSKTGGLKLATQNIMELDYRFPARFPVLRKDGTSVEMTVQTDLVINTICEHLPDFAAWYAMLPRGLTLVLQSNNMFEEPDHVNCVATLEQFEQQVTPFKASYRGQIEMAGRKRFLLIGRKG